MEEVKTGVDRLMGLLEQEKRMSIPDVAKRLQQPEKTIQNWVDFLVEEKILGIEYKFTTPFIYLNTPQKATVLKQSQTTILDERKTFVQRALEKGMPREKLPALWRNHLTTILDSRYEFFHQECEKRSLARSKDEVDELFNRYKNKTLQTYELGTTA
jgi:hypothetical protein